MKGEEKTQRQEKQSEREKDKIYFVLHVKEGTALRVERNSKEEYTFMKM